MSHIKKYTTFINEQYYDDINGYISTSNNKSGFKDGDRVKHNSIGEGTVYDVLVAPNKTDYVVVVKFTNKSIGKYGTEGKFGDISEITKI